MKKATTYLEDCEKSSLENIEHFSIFSLNFFAIFFGKTLFSKTNGKVILSELTIRHGMTVAGVFFSVDAILISKEMDDFNMQEMQPLACKIAKMVKTRRKKN
jgi:hypothetical protein